MAMIEKRITPTWPYILPSARRRSGIAARQDTRSTGGVMEQPPKRVAPHRFRDFSSGKAKIHNTTNAPIQISVESVEQPWERPSFELSFQRDKVYEVGASLLALLACPDDKSERPGELQASLCARALRLTYSDDSDDLSCSPLVGQFRG